MRYPGIKTVFLVLALACCFSSSVASVSLRLQLEGDAHPEVFFAKSLNVSDWTPASVIFRSRLVSNFTDNIVAYFVFSISSSRGVLLRSQSEWFTLCPGPLHLTNLDLTHKESPYRLTDAATGAFADDLMRSVEQDRYLPPDAYQLKLQLHRAEDQILLVSDEIHLEITNPFWIDAVIPAGNRQLQSVGDTLNLDIERITAALRIILGEDYSKLKHDLAGYQPTATIRFNGEDLTLEEFQALADRFIEDGYTIEAVFVQ